MPRIRTIKPDFFTSDTVSTLPLRARLTWIGLWTHCDDYGRCRDNVRLIKAAVWPLDDVSIKDVEIDLNTLADRRLVFRYVVDGKNYLAVTNWAEHQKVDRPSKTAFPAPAAETGTRESLAKESRDLARDSTGKGREGKGGEGTRAPARDTPPPANASPAEAAPQPPSKCPRHHNDPNPPPCGACADARKTRAAWDRTRAQATSQQQSATARDAAETKRLAIAACQLCDSHGYAAGVVCDHDPDTPARASRGAAMARDLLNRRSTPS